MLLHRTLLSLEIWKYCTGWSMSHSTAKAVYNCVCWLFNWNSSTKTINHTTVGGALRDGRQERCNDTNLKVDDFWIFLLRGMNSLPTVLILLELNEKPQAHKKQILFTVWDSVWKWLTREASPALTLWFSVSSTEWTSALDNLFVILGVFAVTAPEWKKGISNVRTNSEK